MFKLCDAHHCEQRLDRRLREVARQKQLTFLTSKKELKKINLFGVLSGKALPEESDEAFHFALKSFEVCSNNLKRERSKEYRETPQRMSTVFST